MSGAERVRNGDAQQHRIAAELERVRRSSVPHLTAFRLLKKRHAAQFIFQNIEPVDWLLFLLTFVFVAAIQWPRVILFGLRQYELTLERGLPLPMLFLWWLLVAVKLFALVTGNPGARSFGRLYAIALWGFDALTIYGDMRAIGGTGLTLVGSWMFVIILTNMLTEARRTLLKDGSGPGGQ